MRWTEHKIVKRYFTTRTGGFTMKQDELENWLIFPIVSAEESIPLVGLGKDEWSAWRSLRSQIDLRRIQLEELQNKVEREIHQQEQEIKKRAAKYENHFRTGRRGVSAGNLKNPTRKQAASGR